MQAIVVFHFQGFNLLFIKKLGKFYDINHILSRKTSFSFFYDHSTYYVG